MNTDQTLVDILNDVEAQAVALGLKRSRGGIARGVAWGEMSGRLAAGGWAELRVHHHPSKRLLQAGLLVFLPIYKGGRTHNVGAIERTYNVESKEHRDEIVLEISRWLGLLNHD
jgi:hypothetical protein